MVEDISISNSVFHASFVCFLLMYLFIPAPALAKDWWIYDTKTSSCSQADIHFTPETLTKKYPGCTIQAVNMGQGLLVLNCSKQKEVGKVIIYGNSKAACLAVAKQYQKAQKK